MCTGSPTKMCSRWPRRRGRGPGSFPTRTGSTEAPLRSASTTTPLLAYLAAPASLWVPSGKIPSAHPSARKARAARIALLPPPSRSTGNDPINSKNLLKGKLKSCFFAIHCRRRGTATQTRTGSAYWLWLEATIRGPSEGTISPPCTVYPNKRRQSRVIARRNRRFLPDISPGLRLPSKSMATLTFSREGLWRDLGDRKSTRLNSSHTVISYAVFCLKKKKKYDRIFSLRNKKNTTN